MDVMHGESECILIANLIVHYRIADIFDQTTQFICIADVVEKPLNLPLTRQWLEFFVDIF